MQRARPIQTRNKSAFLAMLVACSVVFLTALDQTVVVTALPKIITDLSITVQQLDRAAWIVSGYLLGFIIAMPLMGRISDMYGRRTVFLICLGIFALGSLVCGLAPNLGDSVDISFLQHIGINVSAPGDFSDPTALSPRLVWLVAARFVQAVGGGATIPVAMAVAGDFYGEKQRGLALGLIGMVTETGGVLGPLWGAVITQTLGWQAIFFINLPIVGLLALLIWRFIPSVGTRLIASPNMSASDSASVPVPPSRGARIDFVGALLLGASLLCLSLGLSQEAITASPGATSNASQSPIQNNPWLIGTSLLLLALFIVLELFLEGLRPSSPESEYVADEAESRPRRSILPVIEMTVFRRTAFSATSLVSLLVGGALIIAMVDIPFFIDTVLNGSALDSGLALLRLTAMIPVGAILGGLLCPRITCRVTAVIGLLLTALGFLLMHLWPLDVNWLQITASTIIGGLGFGLVIAPIGTTAINAASSRQLGMASSVITVLRMVGMIVGLAALTSWGLGRFHDIMNAFQPPAGITPFSASYLAALGKYATQAGHDVYTAIFLAAGIICLVAIVPALLLEGKKPSPYAIPGTV